MADHPVVLMWGRDAAQNTSASSESLLLMEIIDQTEQWSVTTERVISIQC